MKPSVPLFLALSALAGISHGAVEHGTERRALADWRAANAPKPPPRGPGRNAAAELTGKATPGPEIADTNVGSKPRVPIDGPGAKPPGPGRDDPPYRAPEPSTDGPSVTREPEFMKARELVGKAMSHIRIHVQSPTSPRGQENLREARDILAGVMDVYIRLADKYPDDSALEADARTAQQLLSDCNKGLKVD